MQFSKVVSPKPLKKHTLRKLSTNFQQKQQTPTLNGSSSRIQSQFSNQSIKLRSPSKCHHCGSSSVSQLLSKFKNLEQRYQQTLELVKKKNQIYQSQKKQLERMRANHERDRKQISQLRMMLGLMEKRDFGVQTVIDQKYETFYSQVKRKVQQNIDEVIREKLVQTPKKVRSPAQCPENYDYYCHNYSSQSAKTLPQRVRISKNKVRQFKEEGQQQKNIQSNLRKSRKYLDSIIPNSPDNCTGKKHTSKIYSSYCQLRYERFNNKD